MTDKSRQAWAAGGTIFAATALLIIGLFQIIVALAALAGDQIFVAGPGYIYGIDTTIWGWIHLGLGVLLMATGLALYGDSMWARGVGIALALLSAVGNFMFLPFYPLWSIVIIALDIFVIWSLATSAQSSPPESTPRARRDWEALDSSPEASDTATRSTKETGVLSSGFGVRIGTGDEYATVVMGV